MKRATPPIPLLIIVVLLVCASGASAQEDGAEWAGEKLVSGAEFPVDLAFGPDGTLYYAELRSGQVRAVPPGADAPVADAVVRVDSSSGGNGGFLGLVVDPDFATTGAFFVYYSMDKADAPNGKVNRVSRVTPQGEDVLVDGIPWDNMHDGGRLVFTGPDTLVITTGDNEERDPAQDPDDLRGKTLRVTRAGEPAPDNPDPASPVFTLGHRNPFGIAYDADNDRLWITENGPDRDDEVNLLEAGGNYGWPKRLGVSNDPDYVDPVWVSASPIGPTGATVLHGDLYFGDFNNGHVHRLSDDGNGGWQHEVVWNGGAHGAKVLDVEAGADGRLYVGTYDAIYVLTPPGGAQPVERPVGNGGDASAGDDSGNAGGADTDTGSDVNGTLDGADGDDATVGGGGALVGPTEESSAAPTPGPGAALVLPALAAAAACVAWRRRSSR